MKALISMHSGCSYGPIVCMPSIGCQDTLREQPRYYGTNKSMKKINITKYVPSIWNVHLLEIPNFQVEFGGPMKRRTSQTVSRQWKEGGCFELSFQPSTPHSYELQATILNINCQHFIAHENSSEYHHLN